MAISKVIYGGNVLIDLTGDSVTADKLLVGATAHGKDGEPVEGACSFDVDSSGATATEAEVLSGKTFARGGTMKTGTMPNNGAVDGVISTKAGKYTVPQGYHDGSGKVGIDEGEQAKLIPENIREGVTVLGVAGTMSGTEGARPQSVTVTPATTQKTVLPDAGQGFNYLSEVVVLAIPYTESANTAGGTTVTIG